MAETVLDAIKTGYGFTGPALDLGAAVVDGQAHVDVPVRVPLGMLNRHGLVAGATGTGKTKTLQLMGDQRSAQGVPVFLADIKGDLSGVASPGQARPATGSRSGHRTSASPGRRPVAAPSSIRWAGRVPACPCGPR